MMARIVVGAAPFDLGAEYATLGALPEVGGVGCFVGQVRGEPGLVALTLEHYPGMTERALTAIVAAAEMRWALAACTVIHRVGRLTVGEPIVLVLAASPRREAALSATRFLIDWLKTEAPFWKRAEYADGSARWVEARGSDDAASAAWFSPAGAGGQQTSPP